jgi:hypothetical protein
MGAELLGVSTRFSSIWPLGRLLCVIGVGAIVLLQSATALAAPSPSPALDGILVTPPGTGFAEQAKGAAGIFEGPFDATGYGQITASTNVEQAKQALVGDGFLAGYGRTWVSQVAQKIYVEAVMAFGGAKGAKTWLSQSERADRLEPTFQHAITIDGIDSYYGARLVDPASPIYADAYVFVKGNDTYLVSTVSTKDDLATTAATQTRRQYDSAPPYTVPPSEWPESKASNAAVSAARVVGGVVIGVLIVGLIVVTLVIMRARRPSMQAVMVQGMPGGAARLPIANPIQMSEDRRSWWDGNGWRDAKHEVPPAAQRSEDGKFWWDGSSWRPIPTA